MSDVSQALENLDQAIRLASESMNKAGAAPTGVDGVVAHWIVIVDERFYQGGQLYHSNVGAIAAANQPEYITDMLAREYMDRAQCDCAVE